MLFSPVPLLRDSLSFQIFPQLVYEFKQANFLSKACSLNTEKVALLCAVPESLDIDSKAFESQFNVLFCDYQLILH